VRIRRERDADADAIRRVHHAAFGQPDEGRIVEALRAAGAATLSLVAELDGAVAGHIVFSPVTIDRATGVVGLAPMAVDPAHQRAGIGSALVRAGLDELRSLGHGAVVVLGHVAYYPRFGFVPASRFGLRCEYAVPDEVFMALELRPGALAGRAGTVRYRPELTSAGG
jgi:putative acetyltransferase